jgi:zinc protease
LVIVGQFDPAAIQKLAAELFGDWKSPSKFERIPLPYTKVDAVVRKIETPDKQNALLAGGMTTRLSLDDADYVAAMLANRIFGGTFSSRIVHRIRDKEGLSYGVNSGFNVNGMDDGAIFAMSAICAPQNLPKVEAAFREELARALKDGFTAEEVAAEKKAWLEQLTVQRTQDGSLASTLLARERFGRTMKFDRDMEAKVPTLAVDQVNDAFRRHVDIAALSFVKAGDFKKAGVLQ